MKTVVTKTSVSWRRTRLKGHRSWKQHVSMSWVFPETETSCFPPQVQPGAAGAARERLPVCADAQLQLLPLNFHQLPAGHQPGSHHGGVQPWGRLLWDCAGGERRQDPDRQVNIRDATILCISPKQFGMPCLVQNTMANGGISVCFGQLIKTLIKLNKTVHIVQDDPC